MKIMFEAITVSLFELTAFMLRTPISSITYTILIIWIWLTVILLCITALLWTFLLFKLLPHYVGRVHATGRVACEPTLLRQLISIPLSISFAGGSISIFIIVQGIAIGGWSYAIGICLPWYSLLGLVTAVCFSIDIFIEVLAAASTAPLLLVITVILGMGPVRFSVIRVLRISPILLLIILLLLTTSIPILFRT